MKGDFSRLNLFDPLKQYTRVMQQQGRVQLDADWNEQADILLHYLRTLAKDLIGPFGCPATDGKLGNDFSIGRGQSNTGKPLTDLTIGKGRCYVDGLLCENQPAQGDHSLFSEQPKTDDLLDELVKKGVPFLVYLDVWERHVNYLQADSIREVALGEADTATRAQVVWRVRWTDQAPKDASLSQFPSSKDLSQEYWQKWTDLWQPDNRGKLKAQAKRGGDDTDPCNASPEASYRGPENQLYRVEIQDWEAGTSTLTFKWSRENGSVAFAIEDLKENVATLASLGRDDASGLKQGDWVEIVDDDFELAGIPGPLCQVKDVDPSKKTVKLAPADPTPDLPVYKEEKDARDKHALLRRWDHRASPEPNANGAVLVVFYRESGWLSLENGIQIQFQASSPPGDYAFRPGDYWLIPARTATGDVEWPQEPDLTTPGKMVPKAMPPHGVEHHYAPLALVTVNATAAAAEVQDLRRSFKPLAGVL